MGRYREVTGAAMLCAALVLPGCGPGEDVETVDVSQGVVRETFREPGKTRLARTWPISMPIAGRIGRIELEPGDRVTKGQTLVEFDLTPLETAAEQWRAGVRELESQIAVNEYDRIEDAAKVEADAVIEAAQHALTASSSQVDAERARHERAATEITRMREARVKGAVSETAVDDAALRAETSLIELRRQEFILAAMRAVLVAVKLGPRYIQEFLGRKRLQRTVLDAQLAQMKAKLRRAEHDLSLARVASPIDGVVLERHEQGGGPLPEGQRLLLVGDLQELEVEVEVLTRDALDLKPETRVELEAGGRTAVGTVKRVEPAGFTKLSSLGVEQQRVRVVVALGEIGFQLGVGYRVHATFITAAKENALVVPRHAVLEGRDGTHYVFVVEGGRARRLPVELGLRGEFELEITKGVEVGQRLVAIPDATLEDGARVRVEE